MHTCYIIIYPFLLLFGDKVPFFFKCSAKLDVCNLLVSIEKLTVFGKMNK